MLSPLLGWAGPLVGSFIQTRPPPHDERQQGSDQEPPHAFVRRAGAPHPWAPLQGPEEPRDSEIGSRNTSAPVIMLPSVTPPPPALFFH